VGSWEDDGNFILTDFSVTNPTASSLDVYALFYDNNGNLGLCYRNTLPSGGRWEMFGFDLDLFNELPGVSGVARFAAFPYSQAGARVVNENTVIGGYQTRWVSEGSSTQAPLNSVIFNQLTKTEMNRLSRVTPCIDWNGPGPIGGKGAKQGRK
jgi:hypothetical protein